MKLCCDASVLWAYTLVKGCCDASVLWAYTLVKWCCVASVLCAYTLVKWCCDVSVLWAYTLVKWCCDASVLCAYTLVKWCQCFPHVSKLPTLTYNRTNGVSIMRKRYHTVGTFPKSNRIIAKTETDIPNTQIHGRSFSWLGTGKLKWRSQASFMGLNLSEVVRWCQFFQHVSKLPTLTYNPQAFVARTYHPPFF